MLFFNANLLVFHSTSHFIVPQVFNEICSRRINDEYDFFSGLITNPTFMSVLIITVGLQAIIINLLGIFFKVSMKGRDIASGACYH